MVTSPKVPSDFLQTVKCNQRAEWGREFAEIKSRSRTGQTGTVQLW